jgi:hypothetical protein
LVELLVGRDFFGIRGVVVQLAKDLPGFRNTVLRDEPAGRFGDPIASDEKDEGWDASEGKRSTPAKCEVARD